MRRLAAVAALVLAFILPAPASAACVWVHDGWHEYKSSTVYHVGTHWGSHQAYCYEPKHTNIRHAH